MTTQRVRQSAISGPRSLPKAPKPGNDADDHPWVPEVPVDESVESVPLQVAPGKPRTPRGSVDARRAKKADTPPEERRTYLLGARVPERMRAQVDAHCREHRMSVQEFVEAAATQLLGERSQG